MYSPEHREKLIETAKRREQRTVNAWNAEWMADGVTADAAAEVEDL